MIKNIKFITVALLMSIGFLFGGELTILYLDNFQESYYQSRIDVRNLAPDTSDNEIIHDFTAAGHKYEVDFFFVESKMQSTNLKTITIFGTKKALEKLQEKGVNAKEYRSLFMDSTIVRFEPFEKISGIIDYQTFYYVGDPSKESNMASFKSSLMDKYGGSFPMLQGSDRETHQNLFSVWIILFVIILIITLYEVLQQKKEVIVRVILGEDVRTIFIRSAFLDLGVFTVLFIVVPLCLNNISNSYFMISKLSLLFFLFLAINTTINAILLNVNFKKNLGGVAEENIVLKANYTIKIITTILTILILSSNLVVIFQSYDLYKQRGFFEAHKDYAYYRLNYKPDNRHGKTWEDDVLINQVFYKRFHENSLQYVDLSENYNSPYPVILLNKPAAKEITKNTDVLNTAIHAAAKERIYILMPDHISSDSIEHYTAEEIADVFFGDSATGKPEIIYYSEEIELMGIHLFDMKYQTKWMSSPIIILDNVSHQNKEGLPKNDGYYSCDIMYNIPEEEFQDFVQEFQLEDQIVTKSNVLDVYEFNWAIMLRSMQITIILSLFVIFIELMLIFLIIRLEYRINAIEMALKKVTGYTLFSRNSRIIAITIFGSIISILIAFIVALLLDIPGGANILIGGVFLMALELVIIIYKAKQIEKRTITTILKGERI